MFIFAFGTKKLFRYSEIRMNKDSQVKLEKNKHYRPTISVQKDEILMLMKMNYWSNRFLFFFCLSYHFTVGFYFENCWRNGFFKENLFANVNIYNMIFVDLIGQIWQLLLKLIFVVVEDKYYENVYNLNKFEVKSKF